MELHMLLNQVFAEYGMSYKQMTSFLLAAMQNARLSFGMQLSASYKANHSPTIQWSEFAP